MATRRLSAQKWIIWLLIVSLSIEIALASPVEDQEEEEEETEESRLTKWKSYFEDFFKQARDRAGNAVSNFFVPKNGLISKVARWQRWYAGYSRLCDKRMAKEVGCLQVGEFFFREYAKIDHELFAEERDLELIRAKYSGEQPDESSIEQFDYLFQLLGRLLNHLEALEEDFEYMIKPLPTTIDKKAVDESIRRLQRILLNEAAKVAKGEALELGRIAIFKSLASYLDRSPPEPDSPLRVVAPTIKILGDSDTPLLEHYLRSVKTRAAINAIDTLASGK